MMWVWGLREKTFIQLILIVSVANGRCFLTIVKVDLPIACPFSTVHSRRPCTVDALALHTDGKIPRIIPEAVVGLEFAGRERQRGVIPSNVL